MKIQIVLLKQDDPRKCTAEKLVKFGLAKKVKTVSKNSIILDPFAENVLLPDDKNKIHSITAIDCSWNLADQVFVKKFSGINKKLPPLLAGNPVNFSKLEKLTTVEAISAALFILGYDDEAFELLGKFKWGHTFYELNQNLLSDYSQIKSAYDINSILQEYGISYNQQY